MIRIRPAVVIVSTGNTNIDLLLADANLHIAQAEGWQEKALDAERAENPGIAKDCRQRCLIEQNSALLCHSTARLILDTIPARPTVPVAFVIQQYLAGGFPGQRS